MKTNTTSPDYKGFRFPPEIISHAVWLYFRALPKIWGTVPVCCFDCCSVIYFWKRCKQGALAFQKEDGDGKVSVSALTRRDGYWSG